MIGGSVIKNRGEWHFDWILEGRAIQDIWIGKSSIHEGGAWRIEAEFFAERQKINR